MNASRTDPEPHSEPSDTWGVSELTLRLQRVLRLADEARSAMASRLELNRNEVDAMEHVMGEPIGPVELSRRLHMSSAAATVLVDRLERVGHVRREPDPGDGRRRRVRPTEQGATSVFQEVGPLVLRLVQAEASLTDEERRVIGAYLQRVGDALTDSGYDDASASTASRA